MGVSRQITDALFIVAFLAITGALKAIYAAWTVRMTMPLSRLVATQRRRYTFLALGQSILIACAVWLLSLGSVNDIVGGVKEWLAIGIIGWVVAVGAGLVAVSPILSAMALVHIYTRPALMAYKRFGRNEYRTTRSVRTGGYEMVSSEVVNTDNHLQRIFV